MQSINTVTISGVVVQSPNKVGAKLSKFTVQTTETLPNGKIVRSYIPVASSTPVSKGDIVTVKGRLTTATTKHEDGTYSNYWNVLADKVTNQGQAKQPVNYHHTSTITDAANKVKQYNAKHYTQSTTNTKGTDELDKEQALKLANELLAKYKD